MPDYNTSLCSHSISAMRVYVFIKTTMEVKKDTANFNVPWRTLFEILPIFYTYLESDHKKFW